MEMEWAVGLQLRLSVRLFSTQVSFHMIYSWVQQYLFAFTDSYSGKVSKYLALVNI